MKNSFLPPEAYAVPCIGNTDKGLRKRVCKLIAASLLLLLSVTANAQAPVANFTANKTSGCSPLVVTFQDQSTGDPKFWNWDLGNGQLSNLQNPTAVYYTPGTYTVTLVVRNANGTHGVTKQNFITVYPSPSAGFIADKTIACLGATIQFTDQSSDAAGAINKWLWDFGDGTTSTLQNPLKTYTAAGFYTVNLTVTSSTGCSAATSAYRYIRVVSGVTADFNFSVDSVCRAPFGVSFSNETSGPGNMAYAWDFGNASTSSLQNPVTTYTGAGTYNVRLIATSEYGCADTITKPVAITGSNTSFNAPDSACLNKPVNFVNGSAAAISSFWNFGDGTTSTQKNPVKTFTAPGYYEVKLYNTYANCMDSVSDFITVLGNPTVNFTSDVQYACKGPFTVNFQDISPNAVSWSWDFGDGQTSNLKNPSHTYLNNGQYAVTLRITTSFGCENAITKSNYILIRRPIVEIANVPSGGCIPFTFSPAPNVTSLEPITSYFWDFGHAGATSTSPTPSYTYTDSGTYTIKLRITTSGGCTDSVVIGAAVRTGPNPTVDFKVDTTIACAFGNLKFTDLSNPADRWLWDFGDGDTSSARNPVHAYKDTGSFTITLTASNNGCNGSVQKTQFVAVRPPIAKFDYTVNCASKLNVQFLDSSTVNAAYGPVTYQWDFGDGGTATGLNPSHVYAALGTYNATLTVTNGTCSNTFQLPVKLAAEVADFNVSKNNPCKNEAVTFNAINSNAANVMQYEWTFNGGPPVIGPRSIQHSYPANGVFGVTLTVTDVNGCVNTKSVSNYITVTGPVAAFNAADTGACKNSSVAFTDLSTPANLRQWRFDFGDGKNQTFTAAPFTHNYTDTGMFTVHLTVTDNNGCWDTTSRREYIQVTSPKAMFMAASTKFCPGGILQFSDTSRGYITSYNWDFGDGGTSTLQNPTHVYNGADTSYTIRLIVTDTIGCTDTTTKLKYVEVRRPKPAFTAIDTSAICPPLETKFTLGGTDYESHYWDFGDGQTSQQQNPRHFYNAYGSYTAKLYVAGYGGCIDSAERTINVFNPYTTPFTYTPLDSCNTLLVDFTVAPPANTMFTLYYGDGSADSSQNTTFQHLYKSPSFYSPYLIIKDKLDCQIPVGGPDVIKIYGAEPFFGVDRKSFCDSGTVYFTNYTIANDTIVNSVWNFGDGNTATTKDAVHAYAQPGTYYASLTATTARGCVKTLYDTVSVYRTPVPIIGGADPVCVNSPLALSALLASPDTAITWKWTVNGQTSDQPNLSVTYNTTGVKNITLEASNKIGCKADTARDITVVPLPSINIVADPTVIVGTGIALPVTYSRNVISYNWTPSTGLSCNNCPSPYANPRFTTKYNVAVTDSNGCRSNRDITVTVICNDKNYFIPNTFSPNNDGQNEVFYVRGRSIERIQSMRIFNRWGQMIFEKKNFPANDISAGWDGTINGRPADQDVYVYVIEIICENATVIPYRGNVALVR